MAEQKNKDGCAAKTGKGCLGFLLGPAMLVGAVCMLFQYEGEYVNISRALDEAEPLVERVADIAAPSPAHEGKLVYVRGQASTTDILRDEKYGVEANAIRLNRFVQYAQWVENKTKRSGSEKKPMFMSEYEFNRNRDSEWVYSYQRQWKNKPVLSASFYDTRYRDANRVFYEEQNLLLLAQHVQLGGYRLNPDQIARIGGKDEAIPPTRIPPIVQGRAALNGKYLHVGRAPEGELYYGVNTQDPSIGDVRISWEAIKPTQLVSLVAVQRGNSFEPYTATNGVNVDLLYTDTLSPAQCFEEARSTNTAQLWGVRVGGWLMLWGGFACMLSPLAGMVPFCRKLAESGATVISLLLGSMLCLLTIGAAQLFVRPIAAICLLLTAGALLWLSITLRRKAAAAGRVGKKKKYHNNQIRS